MYTMNARRNFLRDSLMAIAISLLPKILQPAIPEVEEVGGEDFTVDFYVYGIDPYGNDPLTPGDSSTYIFRMTRRNGITITENIGRAENT